jgi:signal transduction histidine kinase
MWIILAGILGGIVMIAISLISTSRLHRSAEIVVEEDVALLQHHASLRDAISRVRRARDRVASGGGAAFEAEALRQLDLVDQVLQTAKPQLPRDGPGSYPQMNEQLSRLRGELQRLSELTGRVEEEIARFEARLKLDGQTVRARLDDLGGKVGRTLEPQYQAARDYASAILEVVDVLRYVDDDSVDAWRSTLVGLQSRSHDAFLDLQVSGGDLRVQAEVAQLGKAVDSLVMALVEATERRAELAGAVASVVASTGRALDALWDGAAEAIADVPSDVRARSERMDRVRGALLAQLLVAFIIAFGIVIALGVFFVAGVERDVRSLRELARAMERGELSEQVQMDRATEELAELGDAFNRLAASLASVREKQSYYDSIVTGLNQTVQLSEILSDSLAQLTRATRGRAGALYLKMIGRDELLLAETFAVPRGADTPELVRFGEGLLGQCARDRRTMVVDDVPPGELRIMSSMMEAEAGALIFAPILYQDELLGVIELAGLNGFDNDTVHFVEDVVFQMAVAINNARAVETIRHTATALERKTGELEDLNSELERANMLKSEFLATVSHELRTPLNAIIGFTDLVIETDEGASDATRSNLGKVLRNAENLLALINDILDLSKIEAGRMDVRLVPVPVRSLVEEVVADFEPLADRKKIELACDTEGAPPTAELDEDKSRRIIVNLVSNAVKFTDEGGVKVRLWQEDDRLLLEVSDTGIGIDPDSLPEIFDKFRQADGTHTRRHGGTGLGLAITKELCHLMNGSVRVFSREGKGSTFTVNLPLRVPEQHAAEDAAPPA